MSPSDRQEPLEVVLAVSGSIAAYKSVEVARLLVKAGARVHPVMTPSARHFIGESTLAGICSAPVATAMFAEGMVGEPHVQLAQRADVVAVVPATADVLGALAQGRSNDLVRAIALCAECPVIAAPAMHPRMWHHPATQRNVRTIEQDGRVTLVGPVSGLVASGDEGMGRMADPEEIAEAILNAGGELDLAGLHVVVSAGPTVEDIDPARFISNRSSGKMGFAVAERAARRGACVTLISGPVALDAPAGVRRINVRSARDMQQALHHALGFDGVDSERTADVLVMAAAVADHRPSEVSTAKLKRGEQTERTLSLVANPDLIAEIGERRGAEAAPFLVAFALETVEGAQLEEAARRKLVKKRVDLVVANRADVAFDGDDNEALLVSNQGVEAVSRRSKRQLADRILDRVVACRTT